MQKISHYQAEVSALSELISSIDDDDLFKETSFKNWTINDVIGHLYVFDIAALLTLKSESEFDTFFSPVDKALKQGKSFLEAQQPYLLNPRGRELIKQWHSNTQDVSSPDYS